jgi:hypothetical protein
VACVGVGRAPGGGVDQILEQLAQAGEGTVAR